MMDTLTRHHMLVMAGIEVRNFSLPDEFDDDPYELDEVSEALVDALDLLDGEQRRKAPLRIPKGFEGGGRFRSISDTVFKVLQDWAKGEGPENPFEGDALKGVLSADPKRRREQLRNAAKARGITLRRGASENEIANALLDDVRKGKGDRKPDEKPAAKKAPAKKATPRAPARKAAPKKATKPADGALSDDPAVREVQVENRIRGAYRALLGRTDLEEGNTAFAGNPSMTPQRLMREGGYVSIADLRDELSDIPRAEQDAALKRIAIHDPGAVAVPESAQASLTDRQRAGALHYGDQDKHWLQIDDPSDRPLPDTAPDPDPESAARARQADIDSARRYSSVAGELDELLHHEAGDEALIHRLESAGRRHGISEEIAPVVVAVRARREVEVENRIRAAYRDAAARPGAFVSLGDIRARLGGDVDREEVDRLLLRMGRDPGTTLVPENIQKSLTDADREGGITLFGRTLHHIRMDDPADRPAPDPRPLVDALLASHGITRDGEAGATARFTPGAHEAVGGGSIRQGAAVEVVRPGFSLDRDGERIRLSKAVVEEVDEPASTRASGSDLVGRLDYERVWAIPYEAGERDSKLAEIWHQQGFDGPPRVVDDVEWERLSARGGRTMHRGVRGRKGGPTADEIVERYASGDHYPGLGVFGNGSYFTDSPETGGRYSTGEAYGAVTLNDPKAFEGSATIEAMLLPGARVITYDELERRARELGVPEGFTDVTDPRALVLGDPGRLAAALGYDAVIVELNADGYGNEILVLNRTATAVRRPRGAGSVTSPGRSPGSAPGVDDGAPGRDRGGSAGGDLGPTAGGDQGAAGADRGTSEDLASLRTLDPEAARDALDLRTVAQLKDLLREQGLPVSGRKRELVDRLVGAVHGGSTGAAAPRSNADDDRPSVPFEPVPKSSLTRDERIRQLVAQGMTWKQAREQVKREPRSADDMDAETRGRVLALAQLRAAGHDVTPGHDELHHYWTRGEGLAKWKGSPKPWTTLVALLTRHVGPEKAKVFASRWFHEVFGFYAGSDLNRVTHGHPPRGKRIGPG